MGFKNLLNKVLFLLSVPTCTSCGKRLTFEEKALCKSCYIEYQRIKTRNCSRCARVLSECSCTNELMDRARIKRAFKLFRYIPNEQNLPANSLIYSLKRDNRSDVLDFCVGELSETLSSAFPDYSSVVFTNVPRRKTAIIKNGFDHAGMLAREVAKRLGADYQPLLKSNSKRAQKKLRRDARIQNAKFVLRKKGIDLSGKHLVIVDDVITSGASVVNAAKTLKALRPKTVTVASLGVAYRDKYTPPIHTYY